MARLGFTDTEFDQHFEDIASHASILFSHLTESDITLSPINDQQLNLVKKLQKRLPNLGVSLANSGGIFLGEQYHFNQVRPGAFIYGINSTDKSDLAVKPVVSLFARVLQIRTIDKVQGVGYNATHTSAPDEKYVTIEAGYADGISRHLSNKGYAYYQGFKLPYAGRVSMDLIILNATHVPDSILKEMKYVELLGENITLNKMAELAGTNGYEVLTSLKEFRFKKEYEIVVVKEATTDVSVGPDLEIVTL
jgi:alanine racemase